MANPSDSETLIMVDNVVPCVYYTGSYGSALMNFVNMHHGFMSTMPNVMSIISSRRCEGGLYYHKEMLYHKQPWKKGAEPFPVDPGQRVCARLFPHAEQESYDMYSKVIFIDPFGDDRGRFYAEWMMKREQKIIDMLMSHGPDPYIGPKDYNPNMIMKRIDETYKVRSIDHAFTVSFKSLMLDFDWYDRMIEYLGVNPIHTPKRNFRNLIIT